MNTDYTDEDYTDKSFPKRRLHSFSLRSDSSGHFRRFLCRFTGFAFLARGERVTSIAERETAADRHQDRAIPDPADKRFVVNAHAPRARADRLAQRDVEMTKDAGIDRGLGH